MRRRGTVYAWISHQWRDRLCVDNYLFFHTFVDKSTPDSLAHNGAVTIAGKSGDFEA